MVNTSKRKYYAGASGEENVQGRLFGLRPCKHRKPHGITFVSLRIYALIDAQRVMNKTNSQIFIKLADF